MDNVSNCDLLAYVLGVLLMECYGLPFHSNNAHIQCLAHVVNIVIQTILKQLNEANDPDINDWYEANKNQPVHYNVNKNKDQREMELEKLVEDGETEVDEVLKDELPKDIEKLSSVQKVSHFEVNE